LAETVNPVVFSISGIDKNRPDKEKLLEWCKLETADGPPELKVDNFTTCWKNGAAFCFIISRHFPHLIDFSLVEPTNERYNLELAFGAATMIGASEVPHLEDILRSEGPDEVKIINFIIQLAELLESYAD